MSACDRLRLPGLLAIVVLMPEELRKIDTSVLNKLVALNEEIQVLEGFCANAEDLKGDVDPAVFQRVIADYVRRQAALEEDARPLRVEAAAVLEEFVVNHESFKRSREQALLEAGDHEQARLTRRARLEGGPFEALNEAIRRAWSWADQAPWGWWGFSPEDKNLIAEAVVTSCNAVGAWIAEITVSPEQLATAGRSAPLLSVPTRTALGLAAGFGVLFGALSALMRARSAKKRSSSGTRR